MFSPYPSTVRYVRLCVNIVIRAVAFSASAGIMASLSIPLKWLLDYLMAVFGVHERVQVVVSQVAIGFPVTLALAILFVGGHGYNQSNDRKYSEPKRHEKGFRR